MPRQRPKLVRQPRRPARVSAGPYHHGDLPRALLDAAEAVLADVGVEGFTLRECARRAGVSHGAPAHHFGDVRGLLTEFTAESFEQLAAAMQRRRQAAAADAQSQLIAVGLAYVDYALAHRSRFQLMFRSDRLDPNNARLQGASAASYGHLAETMAGVCEAIGAPTALRQEKVAFAWAIVHGFATLLLDNAGFARQAGGSREHALPLLERLLQMCQPAFALRALPDGDVC
jgi:AcrR family transcriptional regulator